MTDNNFKFEKNRDFGELFNDTFLFIKYNFKNLLKGMIFFVIPFALIQGIVMGIYQHQTLSSLGQSNNPLDAMSATGSAVLVTYLFMLITYTFSMAFIFKYMKLYKASEDKNIELKLVWQSMLKVVPKIFLTCIAVGIISGLGMILLVIPGIYIMICFSLVIPIVIFQDDSIGEALSSSFSLIKGNWWKTFGFLMVLSLITGALGFVFQVPTFIYQVISGLHMAESGSTQTNETLSILFSMIQSTGASLMQVIPFTGIGLLYFSLIEQKQNPELLRELESVGGNE